MRKMFRGALNDSTRPPGYRVFLLALLVLPFRAAFAAPPPSEAAVNPIPSNPAALEALVLDLDRQMFAAYNAHDVDGLMAFFSPDLEFFHDTGGLLDFAQVKAGFTGVFANNPDIRRDLVAGSAQVFPVKGYGAIETGKHRFCHTEANKPVCGTFSFVQVWHWSAGRWQVARELSYGH